MSWFTYRPNRYLSVTWSGLAGLTRCLTWNSSPTRLTPSSCRRRETLCGCVSRNPIKVSLNGSFASLSAFKGENKLWNFGAGLTRSSNWTQIFSLLVHNDTIANKSTILPVQDKVIGVPQIVIASREWSYWNRATYLWNWNNSTRDYFSNIARFADTREALVHKNRKHNK